MKRYVYLLLFRFSIYSGILHAVATKLNIKRNNRHNSTLICLPSKHETSKPQISAARLSWLMYVRTHPRHPPPLRGGLLLRLPGAGAELRHWHVVAGPDGTGLEGCGGRQQRGLGGGGCRGHGLGCLDGGVCLALRHGLLCFTRVSCGKGIQYNIQPASYSNVGSSGNGE